MNPLAIGTTPEVLGLHQGRAEVASFGPHGGGAEESPGVTKVADRDRYYTERRCILHMAEREYRKNRL